MEPLELAFTVDCPPEHAFDLWANRTALWWPKGHSVSAGWSRSSDRADATE